MEDENMNRIRIQTTATFTALLLAGQITQAIGAAIPDVLPRPDGKLADMSKPVEVFILMGQSNMVGAGSLATLTEAVKNKNKYPYLVDEAGNWTERKDVRYVQFMQGKGMLKNEWMTVKGKSPIGPELGIGHYLGYALDEPVLILKSCIGNRGLGWDLLPPGSERFESESTDKQGNKVTMVYAGYKDSPAKWPKGAEPQAIGWYAGKNYDDDTADAKKVLADLEKFYPGAKGYEVAGFFWWQGDKDRYDAAYASRYEQNLVQLIKSLRKDFEAPNAKFVIATLGQTQKGSKGNEGLILDAMFAVDGNSGKYPEFKGNVATVYANPLSLGGASNGHYNKHAETCMNVGEGMGKAMAEMLVGSSGSAGGRSSGPSAFAKPAAATPAVMRTWTSSSGRKVEATLVSEQGGDVVLQKTDGTTMKIGREFLSKADQDYLSGR